MSMRETLKKAIEECGLSHRQLADLANVNRLSIDRFMNGITDLSLAQADTLAQYFGLALLPADTTKRTRKGDK